MLSCEVRYFESFPIALYTDGTEPEPCEPKTKVHTDPDDKQLYTIKPFISEHLCQTKATLLNADDNDHFLYLVSDLSASMTTNHVYCNVKCTAFTINFNTNKNCTHVQRDSSTLC